jgi:hypothetical protein
LILEIMPQFVTVFCVMSAVIVISQLVRLSEILVTFGLSVENLLLPFLFILMPFISIIVPISIMFAILLAFSRLSADGELPPSGAWRSPVPSAGGTAGGLRDPQNQHARCPPSIETSRPQHFA